MAETKAKKRSCCSKEDFLPEESFKSWDSYFNALKHTRSRLKDRFLARSGDEEEVNQMRARSGNQMKKTLTWWDLMWFGIGSVMGSGIFVLAGLEARTAAGPAVVLSFIVSGTSALLSVFCYTEFAIDIPVAGGSFAYIRVELGDFVAFIAAGNILFEYVISGASVARTWTSYFATLCDHNPEDFRIHVESLPENYSNLDPIAVGVSIIIAAAACFSTKASSRFNYIATILHIGIVIFILSAGLTKANLANVTDNFAPWGARGVVTASAVLFFAYIGFDGVATLAEETKNPARDIPIGLLGSMTFVIVVYCALAFTLCLMQHYTAIDVNAAFSVAFEAVGMKWAKYVVAFGATKAMTTVLLGNIIGQARYFTHIGRTHMAPPWLAIINEKTGTPVNATIVMTLANCLIGFFTDLDVLSSLVSISTLLIFALVALALIVRRYYVAGQTSDSDRNKLIGFLILIVGSSVGNAVCWHMNMKGYVGFIVVLAIWFAATLGLKLMVKEARKPKLWGIPLMPFLPAFSMGFNIFLLGSIDVASYLRFGIWTAALLVYYFLVGLHASYDTAKEGNLDRNVDEPISL